MCQFWNDLATLQSPRNSWLRDSGTKDKGNAHGIGNMASQAKITSFYRNAKQSSNILASKRRKAVIVDEEISTSLQQIPVKQEFPTTESCPTVQPTETKSSEAKTPLILKNLCLEPTQEIVTPFLKTEELPVPVSNLKSAFEPPKNTKEVKKKPSVRKPRKTTKTKETPLITTLFKSSHKQEKAEGSPSEEYAEEVTCVQDNHGCSPEVKELLTPKQAKDNTLSTRKRKMEIHIQESQKTVITPVKVEEKQNRTPVKVRKRLELNGEPGPEQNTASPAKQVQFICMGALSPAKNASPYKSPRIASKLSDGTGPVAKSPAVKSLASLLDKAAPPKVC